MRKTLLARWSKTYIILLDERESGYITSIPDLPPKPNRYRFPTHQLIKTLSFLQVSIKVKNGQKGKPNQKKP